MIFTENDLKTKLFPRRMIFARDLCKALWIVQGRFTTEEDLPEQDLRGVAHTDPVGLSQMEIHVHHRRKRSTHDLGRTDGRISGPTVSDLHGGLCMEQSEGQRNGTYPHVRRIKTITGRSGVQGNDNR